MLTENGVCDPTVIYAEIPLPSCAVYRSEVLAGEPKLPWVRIEVLNAEPYYYNNVTKEKRIFEGLKVEPKKALVPLVASVPLPVASVKKPGTTIHAASTVKPTTSMRLKDKLDEASRLPPKNDRKEADAGLLKIVAVEDLNSWTCSKCKNTNGAQHSKCAKCLSTNKGSGASSLSNMTSSRNSSASFTNSGSRGQTKAKELLYSLGGWQCDQCTVVNPRDVTVCTTCFIGTIASSKTVAMAS